MKPHIRDYQRSFALFGTVILVLGMAVAVATGAPRHLRHKPSAKATDARAGAHCRSQRRRVACRTRPAHADSRQTPSGETRGPATAPAVDPPVATASAAATSSGAPQGGPVEVDPEEGPSYEVEPIVEEVPPVADDPQPEEGAEASPPVASAPEEPTANGTALRWPAPELVDPITIQLGDGFTHTVLSPHRDYIVELPPTDKVGGTWLDGGHNIVVVGGEITIPAETEPGAANDAQRRGIYVLGATGTVHIEGVRINGQPGAEFDGIDIKAPEATVQIENVRVEGIHGRSSGFHGDVVQPWGGVGDLQIDRLSATSDYQGLFLKQDRGPIGSVQISHVDLSALSPAELGGHMLWFSDSGGACATYPVSLEDVYVQPKPGAVLGGAVWPQAGAAGACTEVGQARVASWTGIAVSGEATEGQPAGGSFVPPGVAGLGYSSPGLEG